MSEVPGFNPDVERQPVSKIIIDFARHSLKGPKPREALSPEGAQEAVKAGLGVNRTAPEGKIIGSPRERTGQSSVFRRFAKELERVTGFNFDPEEFVKWLQEGGLDKTETPLLNFQEGSGQYADDLKAAYVEGRYFEWVINKSDAQALETHQDPNKVTPHSVQAGNVSAVVVAEAWEQYAALQRGENVGARLDFATSHQGVLESFLYKVLEKVGTPEDIDAFNELNGKTGFKENQGYTLEVDVWDANDVNKWSGRLTFNGKDYVVPPEVLYQIYQEGNELKQKLTELQTQDAS